MKIYHIIIFSIYVASSYAADHEPFFNNPSVFGDGYGDIIEKIGPVPQKLPPQQVINFLEFIGAIPILEQELWRRTNPLTTRPVIDYPIFNFRPPFSDCPICWFNAMLFYSSTVRMHYTDQSTNLKSYLALDKPTLIEQLQKLFDNDVLNPNRNRTVNVRKIFNLFTNTAVTERKLGFMLQGGYTVHNIALRALMPLYYHERNFFLTPNELRLIEAEFGEADPYDQEQFQNRFIIGDSLGIGDTRIELSCAVPTKIATSFDAGILGIIPTAFPFLRGLRGHYFKKQTHQLNFNFNDLYNKASILSSIKDQTARDLVIADILAITRCFGESFLDRLSSAVLETPLGDRGHGGFGWLLRSHTEWGKIIKREWAQSLTSTTRFSLEYFLPAIERRLYAINPDLHQFVIRNFNDEERAQSNLNFLEQEFINRINPIAVPVTIQPGLRFQLISHLTYAINDHWSITGGSDWWVQGRETISTIHAPPTLLTMISPSKAQRFFAYQSTMHGSINYRWTSDQSPTHWNIGLYGQGTSYNSGIGQETSIALSVSIDF